MGLLDKIPGKTPVQNTTPVPDQLTPQELEFLLAILKQSSFKGEFIELVYNVAVKLQNQYTKQVTK